MNIKKESLLKLGFTLDGSQLVPPTYDTGGSFNYRLDTDGTIWVAILPTSSHHAYILRELNTMDQLNNFHFGLSGKYLL